MRAHAKAVQVLRARAKDAKGTKVGYVLATQITQPASEKPDDIEAARGRDLRGRQPQPVEQQPGGSTRCCSASIPRTA